MGPEQIPENKGGRPPPQEADWSLKEGEMTPSEVKALGHFLYGAVIHMVEEREFLNSSRDPQKEKEQQEKKRKKIDPGLIPAELYIESLASDFELNLDVMKRWTTRASVELVRDNLPVMRQEYQQQRLTHPEFAEQLAGMIEHLERVAQDGIQAAYIDHLIAYNASKTWGKALKQKAE
jgi:hypothetical protein